MKKLSHITKVISFKSIVKFFFTTLILLILFMLYDMANYDSSYLNRRSLTFSVDNLDSKKTISFVRYYDNLYHKIAFKISKDYKKDIHNLLKHCYCFILSSPWEDPGFVLIEAAANNANIISSDCKSGPKEFLSNGKG